MKRFLVAITALVASLAIGMATFSTTAGAAGGNDVAQVAKTKTKKFPATVSLSIAQAELYTPFTTYFGSVISGGPSNCRVNRPVTILRNGAQVAGASATTNTNGSYSVSVNGPTAAGIYTAVTPTVVVKKKKKNKKTGKVTKKKFVCLSGTSPPVTVP
jgi:hypothetical protein